MNYVSTRGQARSLQFEDALLHGLAEDGGLYVPQSWPQLTPETIASFKTASYNEVAFTVIAPFIGDAIAPARLREIIADSYADFADPHVAPLRPLADGHYLLELFHGETLAFKDIAMQLLARLMDEALARQGARVTIIGATSGDTGGAAIAAFGGRAASDIFMLFPAGRVSDVQRRQMTTHAADNVYALAIDGTFDDCQALVKSMFNDADFRAAHALSAVNSINWARVMAQIVYYFTAAAALGAPEQEVAFSVPTGNFGDIFAGFVAKQMGLPIGKLIIATNENDILARTLAQGRYALGAVVATSSPSMDIQISSNFERLLFELYGRDGAAVRGQMAALQADGAFELTASALARLREDFAATRVNQAEVAALIDATDRQEAILLDPHSAVGLAAARACAPDTMPCITLATAHAAKFPQAVRDACGRAPETPPRIASILEREERFTTLPNQREAVQDFIRAHK